MQVNKVADTTTKSRSHTVAKRTDSMADGLVVAKSMNDQPHQDQLIQRTSLIDLATSKIGMYLDWDTNLFALSIEELQYGVVALMVDMGFLAEFRIGRNTMINFLTVVASSYDANVPYHNFYHGFNVFQVCYIMLQDTHLDDYLERSDMLALLIGAVCHDIGHKGVNNSFHKQMWKKDPKLTKLALIYNDASVLENMHASRAFEITTEEGCNIFEKFQANDEKEVRRMMIKGILATDMEGHMEHVKAFKNHGDFDVANRADRTFLIEISMHTSDLSNPTQPWENSKRWSLAVAQEFVDQVSLERKYGLPVSSHMDLQGEVSELNPAIAKLNISFTEYLVRGLVFAFADFFPGWQPRMAAMENNLKQWAILAEQEPPLAAATKVDLEVL